MCGIAGYYGKKTIEPGRIENTLGLMRRRGPDFADYYHHSPKPDTHVYLLHSRLSIIDLDERANQPYRIGSNLLAINGELYNYLELKEELKKGGCDFRTTSDTEVMLQVLRHAGWQGLDECEGMWAFAAYDENTGELLLSRDRFGEKPLYLYRDNSGIYFASEAKFILAMVGQKPSINYRHMYRYLVNGYKALYKTSDTFFEGVSELPAASVMNISSPEQVETFRYWTPQYEQNDSMTYDEAVAGVKKHLIRSVQYRLRADVPLAFCMSGGVDSNALISIARRVFDFDVHGFTIVNTDARYEEQDMVNASVADLGIRHTPVPVNTDDFLDRLRILVRQHDAPIYTISYYVHWLLMSSIAGEGYRISISGTAADELFTGYYDHFLFYLNEIHKESELYRRSVEAWQRHVKPVVRNPYLQKPGVFVKNPDLRDHIYLDSAHFSSLLASRWNEPFAEASYTPSVLRNRMLNELFQETVPVILHEDDLNAMYYSIENRSPFLDRGLFEFTNSIPSRLLMRDGYAKALLRDAVRGIAPDAIVNNHRKVGFNAPIFSLLDVKNTAVRSRLLADSPIFEHVQREKIVELLDKETLPNSESKFLFNFLCSKMFLEEFES